MTGHRVSVIMRTFNRPRMLERALESVASQTWANREAVVVNDGGVDVTDIVRSFRGRLDIVYLHFDADEKPGRCIAATKGIEAATGQWIAYLDDDDVYYPDHLATVMDAVRAHPNSMCFYTDGMMAEESLDSATGAYMVKKVVEGPAWDFSRARFYTGCYIHLSTFVHHRSVWEKHGGFDPELPVLEDLDLYFRFSQDHDFIHVRRFTTQYHIRDDDTNAVTSMRREFRETKEILARKYLHTVVSDMMYFIVHGQAKLIETVDRVDQLMRRVAELESRLEHAPEGKP
jgi:glycosyltransferase involved in cell wall biosynthesis